MVPGLPQLFVYTHPSHVSFLLWRHFQWLLPRIAHLWGLERQLLLKERSLFSKLKYLILAKIDFSFKVLTSRAAHILKHKKARDEFGKKCERGGDDFQVRIVEETREERAASRKREAEEKSKKADEKKDSITAEKENYGEEEEDDDDKDDKDDDNSGGPLKGPFSSEWSDLDGEFWICTKCTLLNSKTPTCAACNAEQTNVDKSGPSPLSFSCTFSPLSSAANIMSGSSKWFRAIHLLCNNDGSYLVRLVSHLDGTISKSITTIE